MPTNQLTIEKQMHKTKNKISHQKGNVRGGISRWD